MKTAHPEVPDLLHRFTPTPLRISFSLGVNRVQLETNDPEIVTAFECSASTTAANNGEPIVHFKLVREDVGTPEKDISILVCDGLITLFRGHSTVIVFDRDRRELLGFLSPDVSSHELLATLIPLLVDGAQHNVETSDLAIRIGD
jgi:hypothetical protein